MTPLKKPPIWVAIKAWKPNLALVNNNYKNILPISVFCDHNKYWMQLQGS